jgi:hypothetical protein
MSSRRLVATTAVLALAAAGGAVAAGQASVASPDVVISEVYGGGGNGPGGGGPGPDAGPAATIPEIQGAAHLSPKAGQTVSGVTGVVTAATSNGFWMQNETPDAGPALRLPAYDVVHVNAEFADQVSDHDPQVIRVRLGF